MKNFKVYQLPVAHNAKFMGLEFVTKHDIMPKLEDYKLVYEGEMDLGVEKSINVQLDIIFRRFNLAHPEDFKGHSLSTSDVVEIDGKYYYCDDYGWEEVVFLKKGDYITRKTKAAYPSIQTLRIEEVIGKRAETTTGIAGGCTVENLDNYRLATEEEKKTFMDMEKRAYASR